MATANQDGDVKPVKKEMGSRDAAGASSQCGHERLPQTGEQPLEKGRAQHSAGCDSHIKLCLMSSIPKSQQMGHLRIRGPMI
eukprot:12090275-Ditylum_brightwellii.AAC.1